MSTKIKSIHLKCFRGVVEQLIELNGNHLLVKGENGSGKSSIVDGLEFFFTGIISHLEGAQGLSLRKHCPHVKSDSENTEVSITLNPGNISLNRKLDSAYTIPDSLKEFFSIISNGTFLLRRAQLLEFIMSKPADRFRAIGNIIGIDQLDDVELNMMRVKEDTSAAVSETNQKIARLKEEIKEKIDADINEEKDILKEINKIFKKYGLEESLSIDDLDVNLEGMLKKTRSEDDLKNSRVLNEILEFLKNPIFNEAVIEELDDFCKKNNAFFGDEAKDKISEINLLEYGFKIIEKKDDNICPLCQSKIDKQSFIEQVNARLKKFKQLSEDISEYREKGTQRILQLQSILNNIKQQFKSPEKLSESISEKTEKLIQSFESILKSMTQARELSEKLDTTLFMSTIKEINSYSPKLLEEVNTLLSQIKISDKDKEFIKDVSLIELLKIKYQEYIQLRSELEKKRKVSEYAQIIYNTFTDCKKRKIQEIYSTIQSDIDSFYSIVHPDEPHTNIRLVLNLGRRASTDLKIDSFDREGEDPRGLTSEGHLDSLGLCIFLAFIKNFNQNCSLIVLDDVVSTVDAQHRTKICKLLFTEFMDYQLVITTHDNFWYEQIISFQRAHNLDNKFVNLRITKWTVEEGPTIKPYKPRWEKIQEKIDDADKSGAGNEGRKYLEWVLETICTITEAPVPFKMSGKYEIGDLLPPAKKRLNKIINDDTIKKEFEELFKELETSIILGNILSHNNPLAGEVSISDVKKFCEDVHNIHEKIICPKCKKTIKMYRDLSILRCPNGRCEEPLEIKIK